MDPRTFCILLMAAFAVMLGLSAISPFLPEFVEQHGANGFWLGMIFAGFGISRGIIMPLVGRISDRTGRKIFVAGGLFLFSVISMLYPRADSVYSMTAVRLAHGLAAGMIMPIVMAYVGEFAKEGAEGKTIGALNMMFYMGLAAGPLIGGFTEQTYGFDAVFHLMSGLGILAFLVVVLFLPESRAVSDPGERASFPVPFGSLIRYNYIKAILLAAVVITLMLAVFMSFLPSIGVKDRLDVSHIGLVISFGIFLAGVLQIPFGRLSDRLDRVGRLLQVSMGMSTGMLALFVVPLCPDFHALFIAGAFVGLGAAISSPALSGLSVRVGQRAGMGTWMGIYTAATSTGFVLTPVVAGMIMDHLGIDAVFYAFGIFGFFLLLLSAYYASRRFLA